MIPLHWLWSIAIDYDLTAIDYYPNAIDNDLNAVEYIPTAVHLFIPTAVIPGIWLLYDPMILLILLLN
jgi:hypothetical protein